MLMGIRNLFSLKIIIGAFSFAICIFAVLLGVLWSAKATSIARAPATALLNIIEVPTKTSPAPTPKATATISPLASQEAPIQSEAIHIGDYVQITGTGGDGLRLHSTAGVSTNVQYLAIDSEVFIVKDGPINSDGYVWWLLKEPYAENELGWGVENYLSVIQNP